MALPLFVITLFVSAFLLFLVQPMIGKLILPKLGGTPQVWNTVMMFFQMVLLAGYGYSHFSSTRLPLKKQILLHLGLLIVPLLFLFLFLLPLGPFNIDVWNPPSEGNPIFSTLGLLFIVIGVPFFMVSTSAPLLQRWFSHTGHPSANDPYFLYAASNLGSLLALLSYPVLIEPTLPLLAQRWTWTIAYIGLGVMIAACCVAVMKVVRWAPAGGPMLDPAPRPLPAEAPLPGPVETAVKVGPAPVLLQKTGIKKKGPRPMGKYAPPVAVVPDVAKPLSDEMTTYRRIRWILLAAIPVSLMLGVTSYCSIDLSPFPLLWVIPLALYLLTFILVFSRWPVPWTTTPHDIMLFIGPLGVAMITLVQLWGGFNPFSSTVLSFLGFFFVVMVCHGELARDRPSPRFLTEFFLLMSFGGMLGGVFNALFAPLFFTGVAEYPIAIVVACLLFPKQRENGWFEDLVFAAFPGFRDSVVKMGNDMARNRGKTPPDTPYVFALVMDTILGLGFILVLNYFTRNMYYAPLGATQTDRVIGVAKFFGLTIEDRDSLARWSNLLTFGPPLVFCFFFGTRPLRFAMGIGALFLLNLMMQGDSRRNLVEGGAKRTYFGVLRVNWDDQAVIRRLENGNIVKGDTSIHRGGSLEKHPLDQRDGKYTYLMHGTTHHGLNFHFPPQLSRLATTYYHRLGPVGAIMERYNWFPGPQNTFWADARMPASLVGLAASPLGAGTVPLDALAHAGASEPPYATIGLGTGTMASYGRWLQHVAFYEIDSVIRGFSEPFDVKPGDPVERMAEFGDKVQKPFFTFLRDASLRGANVEVIMGDAFQSMKREDPKATKLFPQRDGYYKVIEVDAFSSDAIPLHLVTREAIELYMSKLAPDGVVLMHTSNRHMNLVEPIVDIAVDLGLDWRVCKDEAEKGSYLGLFSSEYVVLAHKGSTILKDKKDVNRGLDLPDNPPRAIPLKGGGTFWEGQPGGLTAKEGSAVKYYKQRRTTPERRVWTLDFSNIWSIIR